MKKIFIINLCLLSLNLGQKSLVFKESEKYVTLSFENIYFNEVKVFNKVFKNTDVILLDKDEINKNLSFNIYLDNTYLTTINYQKKDKVNLIKNSRKIYMGYYFYSSDLKVINDENNYLSLFFCDEVEINQSSYKISELFSYNLVNSFLMKKYFLVLKEDIYLSYPYSKRIDGYIIEDQLYYLFSDNITTYMILIFEEQILYFKQELYFNKKYSIELIEEEQSNYNQGIWII